MFRIVSVLDFDATYENQNFHQSTLCERVDLTKLESACRFCTAAAFSFIVEKLKKNPFRKMAFLGSGNYHYVALALISKIKSPFTLVLFDHHADLMDEPAAPLISCGGWVRNALDRLPNLIKVLIVGTDAKEAQAIPVEYAARVDLVPNHRLREEEKEILAEIPTHDVYVSIDKDALRPMDAVTDWDQGKMRIGKMLKILEALAADHRVIGADVCGEAPVGENFVDSLAAMEKNNAANQKILEVLFRLLRRRANPLGKKDGSPIRGAAGVGKR